jgi:uncharacterized small protein (DUF1192 family)
MKRDDEEAAPKRPATRLEPLALDQLGIAELQEYIVELRTEIGRVEVTIAGKKDHRSVADAFFRKG